MKRQNFSFDEQTKRDLAALAARHGNNESEAVRVAIAIYAAALPHLSALILDLDMDAPDIVKMAVAQLAQREIGEGDRDIYAELDELKERLAKAGL